MASSVGLLVNQQSTCDIDDAFLLSFDPIPISLRFPLMNHVGALGRCAGKGEEEDEMNTAVAVMAVEEGGVARASKEGEGESGEWAIAKIPAA